MAYDPEAQKIRCAETAAKLRDAYRRRRTEREDAARRRAEIEERGNFAAVATGTDYEYFVRNVLVDAGYKVRRVGGSGDLGADLLVDTPSGLAVIQCKFYSYKVGYDAVQQAFTAKALYSAASAYVVSNARYTRQARRTARLLNIHLHSHATISTALGGT